MYSQQLTAIDGPESRFSHNVEHKIAPWGASWAVGSAALLVSCFAYLFLSAADLATRPPGFVLWAPLLTLVLAAGLFRIEYRKDYDAPLTGCLAAFFCGLCWLLTAWYTVEIWQHKALAEKVLVIGFFSLIIGFSSRPWLLIASGFPVAITYYYFAFQDAASPLDQMVSVLLLPLVSGALIVILNSLLKLALDKNQQNMTFAEKLRVINHTDDMTQIANKAGFDDVLNNALNLSDRFHTPLSLLTVNIDQFRQYNDALGYQAGNSCLRQLAQFLPKQAKRAVDFVARTGGDEFSIILPGCDEKQAIMLVDKIRAALENEGIFNPGTESRLTLSYGVAIHMSDTPESLYRKAKNAASHAKRRGGNALEVFNQTV